MPPKKKKDGKSGKGKTPAVVENPTVEISNEQLQENLALMMEDLDREREERNFFQMERDKIEAFWDITKRQLQERTADLRNKDREVEEAEEMHQSEIKNYKQKVKNLIYEHQNSLSEQKAERTTAKKVLQTEHIEREFALRKEVHTLKCCIKELQLSGENLTKQLKLKNNEEMVEMQNNFERQLQENNTKHDNKMMVMQKELDLRWTNEIHKIEERKNNQINTLMKDHEKGFVAMKNYYNVALLNNMALINSQKAQIDAALKKVEDLEKCNAKVMQQNKRLVEPLQEAKKEVAELQKQMAGYQKDRSSLTEARTRLKVTDKEMEELKWEYEVLQQDFRKLNEERDTLAQKLTKTILEKMKENEPGFNKAHANLQRMCVQDEALMEASGDHRRWPLWTRGMEDWCLSQPSLQKL
ncbi:hypothetical protein AAFF_G00269860 [Aldrovandia affinis]|uniref:Dynein regulatory complex subunit 4 n=1 Tax=Aldrovandia affinis TaxID=143900 RepID=A0AAD7SSB9_9TELE|nr:hypothetical protein AAFF_G00269860 [Aldrovandia affinis]